MPENAVIAGPNIYGQLQVPYVIHTVGPNYSNCEGREDKGDTYLVKAYAAAMKRAKEKRLQAVAFSLLSVGAFQGGTRTVEQIAAIALKAVAANTYKSLREIYYCAFNEDEYYTLVEVAYTLGIRRAAQA